RNWDLVYSCANFLAFSNKFDFKPKAARDDNHVFCDLSACSLITGLDIGDIEICQQIVHKSQKFIGQVMAVVQNPTGTMNTEPRAQTYISYPLPNWGDKISNFTRVIFQISILHDDNRSRTRGKASD